MNFFAKNKKLLIIAAFWLSLLLAVGQISSHLPSHGSKKCGDKSYPSYYRWDSSWYTQIAQKGYNFSVEKNSSIAYWPLFPFTIKLLHFLHLVDIGYTSTILSILYAFLAMLVLYKLARIDYDDSVSINIVLVFLFFPSTYFLISGYPDSLFVLLTLLSFYFSRKQKWLIAGVCGGLLALTKPYGFLIVVTFFWEYLQSHQWSVRWKKENYQKAFMRANWLPLVLPLVSVAGFMLFNYVRFGTALAFLEAQKTWGRSLNNPLLALFLEAKNYITPPEKLLTGEGFPYIIYFASFLFFLWAMKISWHRVRTSYLLFTALSMLAAFATGTLTSWDRYMMISVASLIGVGVYLSQKKTYVLWTYVLLSGSLLLFLANLFVRCYPVE